MDILLFSERFAPDLGGVARSASRTAHALVALGHRVQVFSWTRTLPAGQLDSHTEGGLTVHRFGLFSNWDFAMQHSLNVLTWLHSRSPFDLVWGHYLFPAGFMAVLFAELKGIPSVVSARGNDVDQVMFPPGDFARLQWTLQRATVPVAVSKDLAHKMKVLLGGNRQVPVVHNIVDAELFAPDAAAGAEARERLAIASDAWVLGFCGELRQKKGAPFLLESLVEACKTRSTYLLLIGEVRPRERELLDAFTNEHPELGARVVITGHQESPINVAKFINACDLMLFPSLWEGMPNALLEAMSCGRLVLASDAGGMPEVISHGQDGMMMPCHELHRMPAAVVELLSAEGGVKRVLSENARNTVLQRFHAGAESAALEEVLALAMSRRPSKSS
jgi:glycosyltransferase involved in cell wall biosynthesis